MRALRRLGRSAGFAWQGLSAAWEAQPNLRLETVIGFVAALLAIWLGTGLVPVLFSIALVLSLELLNSALEATIDLISPNLHPLAGRAKDLSAAAVLVAALGALGVGLLALGPALLQRLQELL